MKPQDVLKTFTEGSCEEMVVLKDIEFYSTCEHHLQPFFGTISIGYLPKGRVLGISKLARLVEVFARRLQIQEKLVAEIADSLMETLQPHGVMVVCKAKHMCTTACRRSSTCKCQAIPDFHCHTAVSKSCKHCSSTDSYRSADCR